VEGPRTVPTINTIDVYKHLQVDDVAGAVELMEHASRERQPLHA
jgi:hypothetical protein